MIVVIRIAGMVGVPKTEEDVLFNLRLRRKYSCVLTKDRKILENIKNRISFGEIDNETLKLLISKRGEKPEGKKLEESADLIVKKLEEGKSLKEIGLKPFFRLHPPIGGFKKRSRLPFPRGVLGENKNINELLRRMLQ